MKRVLSILLAVLTVLGAFSVTAFAAEKKQGASLLTSDSDIISVLGMLDIMVGDGSGNLMLDSNLTRAQFVKMTVNASVYRDNVNLGTAYNPYPDVRGAHWASPYVYAASTAKLVNGYLDGTFRPDNYVKLEEAATIALRLLGYTSSDLVGVYPDAQLAKYSELGLDAKVAAKKGEYITRRDCMYLIYNLLSAETKSGAVYCTTLGYTVASDGLIDRAALTDSKVDGSFVYTDTLSDGRMTFDPAKGTVYRNSVKNDVGSIKKYDFVRYSNSARTLWCYSDKVIGSVGAITVTGGSATGVIIGAKSYAVSGADAAYRLSTVGDIKKDDVVMAVLDANGAVFAVYPATPEMIDSYSDDDTDLTGVIDGTLKGPYIYDGTDSWKKELAYAPEEYEISYESDDNVKVTLGTLEKNDVLYYSNPFKRIYIYRKTVVGTLGSVMLNAQQTAIGGSSTYGSSTVSTSGDGSSTSMSTNISSTSTVGGISSSGTVIVSGKSYTAATDKVRTMLYNGVYKKDDFVTLILGKDNGVVDIIDGDITKILYDDDDTDILGIMEATVKGPIIVGKDTSWQKSIPFDVSSASIVTAGTSKKKIKLSEITENDIIYYSVPFNAVYVYRDTATGVVKNIAYASGMPSAVTVGASTYTLGANVIKLKFYNGEYRKDDFVTLLLGKDGKAVDVREATTDDISKYTEGSPKYSEILEASISDPIIVMTESSAWQDEIPFDLDEAKIYKDNAVIKKGDVALYNVVYYSAPLKSVWVYDDNVTGIYESATPSRMNPTSVVISGATYAIEEDDAAVALSSLGEYKLGDSITVLLGRNGGIVKVLDASETKTENIAVITNVEKDKEFTDGDGIVTTHDALTVVFITGKTATYKHRVRGFESGDLVKVTIDKGEVSITGTGSKYKSGTAATLANLLHNGDVDDNAKILDVYCSSTLRVYASTLKNVTLTEKDILYYELNDDGDIETLLLNDFTGDMHSYMFMTDKTVMGSANAVYEGYMNGRKTSVSGANYANTNPSNVTGVVVKYDGGAVNRVSAINEAKVDLSDITANSCTIDGVEYAIRNDAYFYVYDSDTSKYVEVKAKDFLEGDYVSVRAFYDRKPERGGKVRFIVAK